jgi:hypothetical protein
MAIIATTRRLIACTMSTPSQSRDMDELLAQFNLIRGAESEQENHRVMCIQGKGLPIRP